MGEVGRRSRDDVDAIFFITPKGLWIAKMLFWMVHYLITSYHSVLGKLWPQVSSW